MRQLLLLVFCLVLAVGCGQSYKEALQVYTNEVAALERLEKERGTIVGESNATINMLESSLGNLRYTYNSLPNPTLEDLAKLEKTTKEVREAIVAVQEQLPNTLEPIETRIRKQTIHVQEARIARDTLRPQT